LLQNEFLDASQEFIAKEVSNKRKVYIAYSEGEYDEAALLNMELKLHGISTWFEEDSTNAKGESNFVEAILKCENVLEVITKKSAPEDSLKIAFARSSNKRVIKVASSQEIVDDYTANNEKNIYLWNGQVRIDELITTINGDAVYNSAHSKLLEEAYEWEKSSKSNGKLLALKEARLKKQWYKESEGKGIEPQPNLSMVNFVERSVAYGETLRKRRIGLLWTAALGVILIVILGFSAWKLQGKAQEAIKDADFAVSLALEKEEEAKESQKSADKAERSANVAKEEANIAKEEAENAKEEAGIAQRNAEIAKYEATVAKEEAEIAKLEAEAAKLEAAQAKLEAAQANLDLAKTREALELAKIEADSINFITKGRISALEATEDLQSRDKIGAIENAKASVAFLTDSVDASAQIQSLYDVFTELIPSGSPLNIGYNKEDRSETELIEVLKKSNEFEKETYPKESTTLNYNDKSIQIGSGASMPSNAKVLEILEKVKDKNAISALCLSPDGKRVAIGLKNGVVEMWDMQKTEIIDEVLNHSYRITSIAFNPSGNELAISSIDENFSIVKLTKEGFRDPMTENVKRDNGSRILRLYYWNEHHIITVSWKEYAKIWGTDVKTLKDKL
jgi:hypothetical protein